MVKEKEYKMITYVRPSGSEIQLANTKEMSDYAKANGFTRRYNKKEKTLDVVSESEIDSVKE